MPPPGFFQPTRELGLLWRGNQTVRDRLGLGTDGPTTSLGFVQTSSATGGRLNLYISSADGSVLKIIPGNTLWQLITPIPIPLP